MDRLVARTAWRDLAVRPPVQLQLRPRLAPTSLAPAARQRRSQSQSRSLHLTQHSQYTRRLQHRHVAVHFYAAKLPFSSTAASRSDTSFLDDTTAAVVVHEYTPETLQSHPHFSSSAATAAKNTTSPPAGKKKKLLIIDVREPSELQQTGRIPGAVNMPLNSQPGGMYLDSEQFREAFGFDRPSSHHSSKATGEGAGGQGVEEVVFYCKAGVRSLRAATMALGEGGFAAAGQGAEGGANGTAGAMDGGADGQTKAGTPQIKIGHLVGGWLSWDKSHGAVTRDPAPRGELNS